MGDIKVLYSKVIKDQNDSPYHFEKRNESTATIKAYNPICGDRFELYLDLDEQRISRIYFHGFGCAIAKASSSVLAKSLEGKTIVEANDECEKFLRFLSKDSSLDRVTLPDEFLVFEAVHDFPERYDCASLSWKELKKYFESIETK